MDPISVASTLLLSLSPSLGTFLLKYYLGEFAAAAGAGVLDFGKDTLKEKCKDDFTARKAKRQYEALGDEIIERIRADLQAPGFAGEDPPPDLGKVLSRLQRILGGRLAATFVVNNQIDPQKLANALRAAQLPDDVALTQSEQRIFDGIATRVAQYLFRAATKLPQFDAQRETESIETLQQLASEVPEILDEVRAIREAVVTRSLTQDTDYETSYRNAVRAEFDKVELFGVDLPPELQEARLTDAYVTLRLRTDSEPAENASSDVYDVATMTADEAFARLKPGASRILIRGGAGCGKTTLIRWAALQSALGTSKDARHIQEIEQFSDRGIRLLVAGEQAALSADWRHRMPFVITLRNCSDGKLPKPEDFPAQVGNEVGSPPSQWVSKLLQSGQALVLIDGIDEVPKLNHRDLYASVQRLCAAFHPDNYFVITTRPDATSEVRFEELGFVPAEVEPLEDADRELFIRHWYTAVANKQKLSIDATRQLADEAETLIRQISHTPWLAQLATRPLYCAMTCALYRARRCTLPHGLRAMCSTLCEMIVDRRDRERKLPDFSAASPYSLLTYSQKKLLLRRLAHYFVLAERSTIPVADAVLQIEKVLDGMLHRAISEAQDVFEGLLVRSGMLRLATPEADSRPATVQFVHNTFKEFLAGEQIADDGNVDFLTKKLDDDTWRRVGLFAIAAGSARFQNGTLESLFAAIPEPLPRERKGRTMTDAQMASSPRGRAIYAFRCGQIGNEWSPSIKDRLQRIAKELFPPKSLSEAEWLASAGNAAIPDLSVHPSTPAAIVAACVRALRLIGTPEALLQISAYRSDYRTTVINELVKSVPIHELPGLLRAVNWSEGLPSRVSPHLTDLSDLGIPPELTSLSLRGTSVSSLSPIRHLTQLQSLDLRGAKCVTDLSPISHIHNLQQLQLDGDNISDLRPLSRLTNLAFLHLQGVGAIDLGPLSHLTQLESLSISGRGILDIGPLRYLSRLRNLEIRCDLLDDITAIKYLTQLEDLKLICTPIVNLHPLQTLGQLRDLALYEILAEDLTPLRHLSLLTNLSLLGNNISDLTPLRELSQIRLLSLSGGEISNVDPIENLRALDFLGLSATEVRDIRPLRRLKRLEWLNLDDTLVSDLEPLRGLDALRNLFLSNTRVTDLSPLAGCIRLEEIHLEGAPIADVSILKDFLSRGTRVYGPQKGIFLY